jgi:hypothetical protein
MLVQLIPTKVHGALDYPVAAILMFMPMMFDFNDNSAAMWTMVIAGIVIFLASLITRYETGLADLISMRTHLMIDVFLGTFLIASPWLFGFTELTYLPHVLSGSIILVITLLTKTQARQVNNPVRTAHAPRKTPEKKWSSHH